MKEEEFRKLVGNKKADELLQKTPKEPKKNKYNAVKKDGFDSIKEYNRAVDLQLLEKAGKIQNLQYQVPYILQNKFEYKGKKQREIKYIADFVYYKGGQEIVEDTKGFKTQIYRIKKKLLLYKYPEINFLET